MDTILIVGCSVIAHNYYTLEANVKAMLPDTFSAILRFGIHCYI